MPEILLIADDLTGAADTGVQFLSGGPIRMVDLRKFSPSNSDSWGLVFDTETRNIPATEVPKIIENAARIIKAMQPKIIYKKIDSCLRGHAGLELVTLIKELDYRGALVAPAYPTFQRITKGGIHYVAGIPVSESETARDPVKPVLDSRITVILAENHTLPVHLLELEITRQGVKATTSKITEFLSQGQALIAAEAETEADLNTLAKAGTNLNSRLIFSGSAGLGQALSSTINPVHTKDQSSKLPNHPDLFLCGSASSNLRLQVESLIKSNEIALITLDPEKLILLNEQLSTELSLPEPGRALVVNLPQPLPGNDKLVSSQKLIHSFGLLAARLIEKILPKTIFISGGDTAMSVINALKISEAWLRREIEPGVVFMETDQFSFLTKSGGFGDQDLLNRLYTKLP